MASILEFLFDSMERSKWCALTGDVARERAGIDTDRRVLLLLTSGTAEGGRVEGFFPDLWSSIIMTGLVSAEATIAPVESVAVNSILQTSREKREERGVSDIIKRRREHIEKEVGFVASPQ
jgi:hypothetical protein